MTVTDVKIRKKFDNEPLKAICSVTIDDAIAIHDIKIVSAKGKMLIVMPARKSHNGEYSDIIHPINSDARAIIENAIISEYTDSL